MIRLHCTKKLYAKLPLLDGGRLQNRKSTVFAANDDDTESPLSGWHANLLLIQRRQCVLFVHDATRFPVFVPTLKKADFAELDERFTNSFLNTLLKTGSDDALLQRAHRLLGPLVCDTDCNRSVQGSMNQMAQDIAFNLEYDNVPVVEITGYRVGAWLADRPCTVKGVKDCIWPDQAMRDLLLAR